MLLAASCTPRVASDAPLPESEPEAVGIDGTGLDRIRPAMQRYVDEGLVSGIITLVARQGRLVHWDAVGHRDIASGAALGRNDVLRICSMTKPITSVGVMMLVEQGALSLGDPVARYLPVLGGLMVQTGDTLVAPKDSVTIAHLLSHTSGMTYGLFGETRVDSLYRLADVFSGDLPNLVEEVGALPLIGHPGEVWNYGVSTDVLGRVIEVVSGERLDEFSTARARTARSKPRTARRAAIPSTPCFSPGAEVCCRRLPTISDSRRCS
jgi:CubicO group peptidase (beta-lactamase class C family)